MYSKTLYGLIVNELRVFTAVYVVILFAFMGGTTLALRATTSYNSTVGFQAVGVRYVPFQFLICHMVLYLFICEKVFFLLQVKN